MASRIEDSLGSTTARVADASASLRSEAQDLTTTLVAEAQDVADRIATWIAANDPVGQAREVATDSMDQVRDWSSTLPSKLAAALPVVTVTAKPKKRTMVAAFAAGAAVAYFFDPTSGADRRAAVKQKVSAMTSREKPVVGESAA